MVNITYKNKIYDSRIFTLCIVINEVRFFQLAQPVDDTTCVGSSASFTIVATGPNLEYQWQKEGVDIPGETNDFLAFSNVTGSDEAAYACIVSNACGGFSSSDVDLVVNDSIVIISQPASAYLCEGSIVNFNVIVSGTGPTYRWQKNGSNLSDGGSISGSQGSNLSISGVVSGDEGAYACIITGACGIVSSDIATLSVDEPINITAQPASQDACRQETVIFSVTSDGTSLNYQWQYNGVDIPGENLSALVLNNVTPADAGNYNCLIDNICSSTTSATATLSVHDSTLIVTDPVDVIACEGGNTSFTVTATGGNLTYRWKKNGTPLVDGGTITGSFTDQLVLDGMLLSDAGIYTCEVTGTCGAVESSPASLVVNEDVVINTQPLPATHCPGETANFSVSATGAGLGYQWQHDGSDLGGQTASSLSIPNVSAADAGIYKCIITGACRTVSSNSVNLTVLEEVAVTLQPVGQFKCEAETVGFSVNASGTNPDIVVKDVKIIGLNLNLPA